jgi:putative redox protein
VRIKALWEGQMKFTATGEANHAILMNGNAEAGVTEMGIKPTEMVLMGLAGCCGIDVVHILGKMRDTVEKFTVEVDGVRNESEPRRFTLIRVIFNLQGAMKSSNVERAIRLSFEKYCSVSNSLNAEISFAYTVNGERYPTVGFMD